ncbi:TolC family protein [Aurantiacibacter sp. MUD11]|uniref:TolC family protein n=1 Tax=Aurantiacibacter sp. MUD11 TaxID=3003265 RepID=UPI0022AA0E6A|nr:TolC family protein [Aurantiacibacter sp. MUD11]WAT19179.1 TolC family protein [Aurantiacibacter sp. MUD11]
MRLAVALLPLAALAMPLAAEPGLPDEAQVAAALDAYPAVEAAQQRVGAARSSAEARAASPHDFIVTGSYTRRSIELEGDFDEFNADLMRGIRLPGKARLDREIGVHLVDAAENMAEDTRHQAALILAQHWWDWLSASAAAKVDEQAVSNLEAALRAVQRRVELGDAAALEADQAEAALGAARVRAAQSVGEANLARTRLATHFPALALPSEAPEIPVPEIAQGELERYSAMVVANSHEIAAAEAQSRAVEASAQRARLDRVADPSVGIRVFSERGGAETGAGLVFSMPFGGSRRGAVADQAAAEASAAIADARMARFAVNETAAADLAQAQFRIESWQRAREGLRAQMAVLSRMRRGHELGEIDLADLLFAERMTHDAFSLEVAARAEAQRAITQIRIDSHELWLRD